MGEPPGMVGGEAKCHYATFVTTKPKNELIKKETQFTLVKMQIVVMLFNILKFDQLGCLC